MEFNNAARRLTHPLSISNEQLNGKHIRSPWPFLKMTKIESLQSSAPCSQVIIQLKDSPGKMHLKWQINASDRLVRDIAFTFYQMVRSKFVLKWIRFFCLLTVHSLDRTFLLTSELTLSSVNPFVHVWMPSYLPSTNGFPQRSHGLCRSQNFDLSTSRICI